MSRVAIVTDSACDLDDVTAEAAGITIVPLLVRFGEASFRSGTDLPMDAFYDRLLAPGAPFPSTAACSPGDFQRAFEERLAAGAEAVVCVTVGSRLSATLSAAQVAADAMPESVHVVDSASASMGQGLLALAAAEAATAGETPEAIVSLVEDRRADARVYVALETLEYLRRGGRISAAQAAIGSVLSVKPIITIQDGAVETVDRPRTHARARARLLELLAAEPVERIAVLHTRAPGIESFAQDLALACGVGRESVTTSLIGPSVAPHVGPGAYGAAVLRAT
jgi:DegV family protein with EDD domain